MKNKIRAGVPYISNGNITITYHRSWPVNVIEEMTNRNRIGKEIFFFKRPFELRSENHIKASLIDILCER